MLNWGAETRPERIESGWQHQARDPIKGIKGAQRQPQYTSLQPSTSGKTDHHDLICCTPAQGRDRLFCVEPDPADRQALAARRPTSQNLCAEV
jgi:hypothetical protein